MTFVVQSEYDRWGYCPTCLKPGIIIERRLNGVVSCANGHSWNFNEGIKNLQTVETIWVASDGQHNTRVFADRTKAFDHQSNDRQKYIDAFNQWGHLVNRYKLVDVVYIKIN
ncbi:MAG: hypothetical protein ACXW2E_01025 [Nitrososphaeraceae archaeon]